MLDVTGRLVRICAGWTVALGLIVLAAGAWWGFGTGLFWLVAGFAGLVELSIVAHCCRAWGEIATIRWFWWWF